MLVDVKNIELYVKEKSLKPVGGLIGYKIGDEYVTKVTDSYRTMFAYYYFYEEA
jgi:hypothetical protein